MRLPYREETYDRAVSFESIYFWPDPVRGLKEIYRVLKKGGTFAIHDIMSPKGYGDMRAFVKKLKECGYEKVELVDTTDGLFLTRKESRAYMLAHSKLLVGKK